MLLNWRIWAAVMVAIFLAGTHWKAYHAGKAEVQALWNDERLELSRLSIKLQAATAKASATLQANTDKRNGELRAKINRIASERDRFSDELRNRPERPTTGGLPASAGNAEGSSGCTGSGLYRIDAEFLARFAADRAVLQAGLKACYAQYEAARASIESVNATKE